MLERLEWVDDPRFLNPEMRSLNRSLLIQMIGDIIITQPLAHWQARLIEQDVPCSPVNTIDKVVVQPQVLARDMVHEMDLE